MLDRQRISPAGEQTTHKEDWEALIAKEATAYFEKLDVCPFQLHNVSLDHHILHCLSLVNPEATSTDCSGYASSSYDSHVFEPRVYECGHL